MKPGAAEARVARLAAMVPTLDRGAEEAATELLDAGADLLITGDMGIGNTTPVTSQGGSLPPPAAL